MKNDKLIRLALTSAILAVLSPIALAASPGAADATGQAAGNAAAQTTAPTPAQRNRQGKTTTLQAVVVTASPTGVKSATEL